LTTLSQTQRSGYDALVTNPNGKFGSDRPALFSPAIAAQEPANSSQIFYNFSPILVPFEYTNWVEESRAHTTTCYIGDWTPIGKLLIEGRDALAFLSYAGVSKIEPFEIGRVRHHVQVGQEGHVASEGILYRVSEDRFLYTGGGTDYTAWLLGTGDWDARSVDISAETFLFEIQGPNSLKVMEKALGQNLRDLRFNRGMPVTLEGVEIRLLRTGISGELGYELHGPAEHAARTWQRVVEAGAEFGIKQLGAASQLVAHIETGIATTGLDYLPSSVVTPGAQRLFPKGPLTGSFIPARGVADFFRYPGELGWGSRVSLDSHEFQGRAALRAQAAQGGPERRLMGLEWNFDDVRRILTAMYDDEFTSPMQIPRTVGVSMDRVLSKGKDVGISSSRTFSASLRKTISLCVLDKAVQANEMVTVVWGAPGTSQREVRAEVHELPMKPDRRRTDVATDKHGKVSAAPS